MVRMVLCCALVVMIRVPCWAQQTASVPETVIKLSVTPAPEPAPALRYLLLPELKEMNPGNPIHGYLKCFMEQQKFFFDKEAFDRREKLLTMPLKELPLQELEGYGRVALTQADWAARLDHPDWQILLKLRSDGVGLLIPDVQQLRTLANALRVRFRGEIAAGRCEEAMRTAKTMFAMARHLGEHPTYVGNLVGIAVAFVAIGPLEELLEQDGCPNLYWALSTLPRPLVSLEKGTEGERMWVLTEFRELSESAAMSDEQLTRFINHIDPILAVDEPDKPSKRVRDWLNDMSKVDGTVDAARRRLIESGLSERAVNGFPAHQVILLDEKRAYEVRRDDQMKIIGLPVWEFEAIENKRASSKEKPLFDLEPEIRKVRQAQTRLEQRIALLRVIESLRMHAARHEGKLPTSLAELSPLAPEDPGTGKPFHYELTGAVAHLRGSAPRDRQSEPSFNVHYEVTIRK
jgi:hypothetical protein